MEQANLTTLTSAKPTMDSKGLTISDKYFTKCSEWLPSWTCSWTDIRGQRLFMYTLRMSRSSRALALGLAILWVVAPQMACFMPETMTESEHECCQQMAN